MHASIAVVAPATPRPLTELERELSELASVLNAAQHRFLVLLAEFDARSGWSDGLTRSCAHWLNWKLGIALGAAREKVRVAHALAALPRISAAMACGTLSYSKVRAMTRVATPANEDYLLMIAEHGTASHVERLVSGYRRAVEAEELSREARQHVRRAVQWFEDDDGSLILRACLPAEVGRVLVAAIQQATAPAPPKNVSAETSAAAAVRPEPTLGMRRADALGAIAESFLAHGPEDLKGGDRQQIIVHVDAATLAQRTAGRCEIEHGPALAAETARRLACDASLVQILEDEKGTPLDVGRKTRSIPPALQRALRSRDREGCRFPGCTQRRFVDAHHIRHWCEGGETKLSNLVSLCRFHHRALHEGGCAIEVLDDGALRFIGPDGKRFERGSSLQQVLPIAARMPQLRERFGGPHAPVHPEAAVTGWRGEPMDLGIAVELLLARR